MKKTIIALLFIICFQARANFFDFTQFAKAFLSLVDVININLEKVRLAQQKQLDIREQWDFACETTQSLNQSVVALNKMFSKYKVSQETCTPITAVLNLQIEIIKNCQNYYSKPVPDNAEILLNKFTITLLQSKMILTKCYPALNQIKIPGLPSFTNSARD